MDLENSTLSRRDVPRQWAADDKLASAAELAATAPGEFKVIRRNGKVTVFDGDKIKIAITKAFLAVEGGNAAASSRIHETVDGLTQDVARAITRRMPASGAVHIEDIQDQVELALMRGGEHKVARAYVLYREERARERSRKTDQQAAEARRPSLTVTRRDGTKIPLDENRLEQIVVEACQDIANANPATILDEAMRSLFDGVAEDDERELARGLRGNDIARVAPREQVVVVIDARPLRSRLRRDQLDAHS
jgi:ribonucleoside-diphosphate reductase alpha chain